MKKTARADNEASGLQHESIINSEQVTLICNLTRACCEAGRSDLTQPTSMGQGFANGYPQRLLCTNADLLAEGFFSYFVWLETIFFQRGILVGITHTAPKD